jgi:hypothetical protein
MRVMRLLQNILVVPFFVPFSVGATGARGLLPSAREALLGETFRENRQSRVPPPAGCRVLTRSQAQHIPKNCQYFVYCRFRFPTLALNHNGVS